MVMSPVVYANQISWNAAPVITAAQIIIWQLVMKELSSELLEFLIVFINET